MNDYKTSFWQRHLTLAGILVLLSVPMLALFFWGFNVATSDVKGRGDTQIIKNSANNRIAAQQRFEDLYADIKATDQKLTPAAADKKSYPGDHTFATIYSGLINHCQDTIASYDAEARKVTAEIFRSSDLPVQIDKTDPNTDCKEN